MYLLAGVLLRHNRHFTSGPVGSQMKIIQSSSPCKQASHWQQNYIQDWILQMRTTELWKIVCKLTGWLGLKCSFRARGLKVRFPPLQDRHYFRYDAKGTAFMLSGCLITLITVQNDIILIVHGRKRFELNTGTCVTIRKRRMSWDDNHGTSSWLSWARLIKAARKKL